MAEITIVIPAYNEAGAIAATIANVEAAFRDTEHTFEVIVVDDHSQDDTAALARDTGVRVISHPTNKGYGNALLTGIRNASHPWIAITDADGTYPIERLPGMLDETLERGLDMLVGARQGPHYEENVFKGAARYAFKRISQWVVGDPIPDINSGLRIIRKEMVTAFAPALSGGFSFTTSITIIAFQTGHHVAYVPVDYHPRTGKSHVRLWRDTKRALQIIVMTIVLFNPIKLYLMQALAVFWYTVAATLFALCFPQFTGPVLLASAGLYTCNLVMAIGFTAVRHQINIAGIDLPSRGFTPDRDRPGGA